MKLAPFPFIVFATMALSVVLFFKAERIDEES
jgi:hypothetical protein